MTQVLQTPNSSEVSKKFLTTADWQKVIKEYLDPPSPWNITVGLFLGGYS